MKILVIGASGFLGSSIAKAALAQGWKVWGIYNKNEDLVPNGCKRINIDELNQLEDNFDLIYIAIGNFVFSHEDLIYTNIDLSRQICDKFKSAKIIFISSINVYGAHNDTITLNSSFNTTSPYGLSKLAGESIISKHGKFVILRFTNLYGVGMNEKSFISTIIKDAIKKKVITLTNTGERKHDYLYVEDAVQLCIKAGMRSKNEIYLGATGKSVSNLKVAKLIQKLIPDCKIIFSEGDFSPSFSFDVQKTKNSLSWTPKKKLEEGLKELVNKYENINI